MGIGIWSMHFVGMLAFRLPGIEIYYDVTLMVLSILVAIVASALALYIVSSRNPSVTTYFIGSLVMGAAIAGMHYIGIASMRLAAVITWDFGLVITSILVAIIASYLALFASFNLREDVSLKGFGLRVAGGVLLGFAIAGMHYTAMAAMSFSYVGEFSISQNQVLATDGMATMIIIATLIVLGIALSGSNIDRALTRKTLSNEILQQGIKARDEFVSVASHELRTPMTSIKLQIGMIIRQLGHEDFDREKIISMLTKTDQNLNQLNRLVEDMLDIARTSSGKLSLSKEKVELSDLVSDVIMRIEPMLEKAQCKILFEPTGKVSGLWDRFRLEQVVVNLLSNAIKYAPGKPITVSLTNQHQVATISVKDQGSGILPDEQERIFNRFERGTHQDIQTGLGLGLFIVKEIVTMHDGDIKLHSSPNQGAEFIVSLPLGC